MDNKLFDSRNQENVLERTLNSTIYALVELKLLDKNHLTAFRLDGVEHQFQLTRIPRNSNSKIFRIVVKDKVSNVRY